MQAAASQNSASALRSGDVVAARAERWQVAGLRSGDDCEAVRLRGTATGAVDRTLLHPFDTITRIDTASRVRPASRRRCRRLWLAARASVRAAHVPLCAAQVGIDLLPYQLEPAIAILQGLASRVLLADRVGLGKTIQAGIVLSELLDRGLAARALVLCPAGLRAQWRDELASRFALETTACDAAWLADRARRLAPGTNPWSAAGVLVASTEFLKQPEVLQGLRGLGWDLLVVDEAHAASRDSERTRAVHDLAACARFLLLLTATPHDGDQARFERLAGIGRLHPTADPIALFRRERPPVAPRVTTRSVLLRVRLTRDEHHVHDLLGAYTTRIAEARAEGSPARLVASVLRKRAFSTFGALLSTLERRRALLSGEATPATPGSLPFEPASPIDSAPDTDLDDHLLGAPALHDRRQERAWLGALVAACRAAARHESKVCAIERVLRATREPMVVFTEFRDSLSVVWSRLRQRHGTAILHGGLGAEERGRALAEFAAHRARVLVATDVASEGLNLQHAARLVVNLELPWSPVRLEQRAGRVDRLGQSRRVHVVCLVGRDTGEEQLRDAIVRRLSAIRAGLDAPGRTIDPRALTPSAAPGADRHPVESPPGALGVLAVAGCVRPSLSVSAGAALRRLLDARRCASALSREQGRPTHGPLEAFAIVRRTLLDHEREGQMLRLGHASRARAAAEPVEAAAWIHRVVGPSGELVADRIAVAPAAGAGSPCSLDDGQAWLVTVEADARPLIARDRVRRRWIASRLHAETAGAPRQLPLFTRPGSTRQRPCPAPEALRGDAAGDAGLTVQCRPILTAPIGIRGRS
jgi:superfamily II DNA or RNA helicase